MPGSRRSTGNSKPWGAPSTGREESQHLQCSRTGATQWGAQVLEKQGGGALKLAHGVGIRKVVLEGVTFQCSPKGWVSLRQARAGRGWIRMEGGCPVSGLLGQCWEMSLGRWLGARSRRAERWALSGGTGIPLESYGSTSQQFYRKQHPVPADGAWCSG